MSLLRHAPRFDVADAAALVRDLFGVHGRIGELDLWPGEHARRLREDGGDNGGRPGEPLKENPSYRRHGNALGWVIY